MSQMWLRRWLVACLLLCGPILGFGVWSALNEKGSPIDLPIAVAAALLVALGLYVVTVLCALLMRSWTAGNEKLPHM